MILVTGATGFVGRALLPRLAEGGHTVRVMLRPSRRSPQLPRGVPVQVSIARLDDERGLRAAMAGVEAVIHLVGSEWRGPEGDPLIVDAAGTRGVAEAARAAGVKRLIYLSHLGADRASAYPVLKAKGIAEEFVRQSGVPYTILRSALLFGPDDLFVNVLAALLKLGPGVFLLPGDGRSALQPLWVDDLATCIEWSLAEGSFLNETLELGGPEFIPLRMMVETVMEVLGVRRLVVPVRPVYLRAGAWFLEQLLPRSLLTTRWLDYLAISRTCELTSVTQYFGLKPTRFSPATLGYLRDKRWLPELRRFFQGA
ncbi:MAG: NAD(P)H-binding protein [Anaerolineales bacterium]|nr:NAD(P)H-binding protein [Anaerolineales bacterium]